ncbi:MAG TPA: hypothetical protein VFA24_01245 [Gaiellaceae bacterium]|nr:hypothetical protein [Gaiellaceae bacterium]
MSEDESTRDRFASDEGQEDEDVEAHRKSTAATDDGDDADDVEAHRHATGA